MWEDFNKFDSTKSLGVCHWGVKIPQCGYMGHGLKFITFHVKKFIAALAMCHNTTLVRDKPLGAPTYVKLVYYDNAIVPHIWYLPQRKLALETRTRWRRVKTLGQHQVGVNLQSHAQHQLWISTWHIFHEFHKIMPSLSYPVSLVNQNVILVNISHRWLHMAWIMSLMSTYRFYANMTHM